VFNCFADFLQQGQKVITMDMIGKVKPMRLRDRLSL
jgi:hypothetical protein